jgi:hypothetical protein
MVARAAATTRLASVDRFSARPVDASVIMLDAPEVSDAHAFGMMT